MRVRAFSLKADQGGASHSVAISGTSAASNAISSTVAYVSPTVDCFYREGAAPTALANGTDQFLLGGASYRIELLKSGDKLAFITSGAAGTVYITPGA